MMHRTLKNFLIAAAAALFCILPSMAAAVIEGNCNDCHTMHNSEFGQAVAIADRNFDNPVNSPNESLLRMDCISCHAQGGNERIVTMPGGSRVPQVYHVDDFGDLAAGNFAYISGSKDIGVVGIASSRKGHDVIDLFPEWDDIFTYPPGFIHSDQPTRFQTRHFTCAGVNGCHGARNQLMEDDAGNFVPRVGLAAIRGAHHANVDGRLDVADSVPNSFRWLMGLKGLENPDPVYRWQNFSGAIHNEYYGYPEPFGIGRDGDCFSCHVGFCATCHSDFHQSGIGISTFLRHPSDFIIPNSGEFAEYTVYEITAPVARPRVYDLPSDEVIPGEDMVMCLSCHMAHASPYDGMLRFDYTRMIAGNAGEAEGTGCFACHTNKGR